MQANALLGAVLAAALAFSNSSAFGKGSGGGSHSSGSHSSGSGEHYVAPHNTKSGNHVTGHHQSNPNGAKGDKGSSQETIKPHAGEAGKSNQASSNHAAAKHADGSARAAPGVQRDADGKIHRSAAAKDSFKKGHPCPSTGKSSGACPGYVIDHVRPLKRGGQDAPSNMQWQSTAAAKAKDKAE